MQRGREWENRSTLTSYEIIKSIFHSQQNQELFLLEGPLIKMMNALINILKKTLAMQ